MKYEIQVDLNDLDIAYRYADELLTEYYGITLDWFKTLMKNAMIGDRRTRILLLSIFGYKTEEIAKNFGVGKDRIYRILHETKSILIRYLKRKHQL
jgi:hypothetical protein